MPILIESRSNPDGSVVFAFENPWAPVPNFRFNVLVSKEEIDLPGNPAPVE